MTIIEQRFNESVPAFLRDIKNELTKLRESLIPPQGFVLVSEHRYINPAEVSSIFVVNDQVSVRMKNGESILTHFKCVEDLARAISLPVAI